MDNVYDTTIYTDYFDLTEEKKKALYDEYLKSDASERKLSLIMKFAPLALYAVIVGLIIASLVISIAVGAGVTLIILLATLAVVIGALIILQVKLTKVRRSVAERYSVWLKTQKRIIAELKDK